MNTTHFRKPTFHVLFLNEKSICIHIYIYIYTYICISLTLYYELYEVKKLLEAVQVINSAIIQRIFPLQNPV